MPNLVKVGRPGLLNDSAGGRHEDMSTQVLPSRVQRDYLRRGVDQPGGKLPLFDENGARFNQRTIRSCIDHGWAEPWISNPHKPDWQVCKLTEQGRAIVSEAGAAQK